MLFQEFAERIRLELEQRMDGMAEVTLEHLTKTNGTERVALCVLLKGQNTAPALYLDDFYERHMRGVPDRELILDILKILRDNWQTRFREEPVLDRRLAMPKLRAMLLNREKNETRAETCPNRKLMDLMVCYYLALDSQDGPGRIAVVNNGLAEHWGVTEPELYQTALSNMRKQEPDFASIRDCLREYCEKLAGSDHLWEDAWQTENGEELPKLYVLTNPDRYLGAGEILVPGRLADCCRRMDADRIYILPSSIHEVLLLKADCRFTPEELVRIVREVNREAVSAGEQLADSLYRYDWISGETQKLEFS